MTAAKLGQETATQEVTRRQTALDASIVAGDQAIVVVTTARNAAVGMIDSAKDVLDDIRDELLS